MALQNILVIFQVSTPDQRAGQQGDEEGQPTGTRNNTTHFKGQM